VQLLINFCTNRSVMFSVAPTPTPLASRRRMPHSRGHSAPGLIAGPGVVRDIPKFVIGFPINSLKHFNVVFVDGGGNAAKTQEIQELLESLGHNPIEATVPNCEQPKGQPGASREDECGACNIPLPTAQGG
jgi:hypothetical protein